MKRGNQGRILIALVIALALAAFYAFDLDAHFTLAGLKAGQAELAALVERQPVAAAAAFFLLYVAMTGCSLPGAALVLSVAAGALFGLLPGIVIVSFASATGASVAFLSSRYLLREWVKGRFEAHVAAIDRGTDKEGALYLFCVRLIPPIPYNLTNLAAGLTSMRLATFYLVTQIGMIPVVVLLVYGGTQLARIESEKDLVSPALIGSLLLLALLPAVGKYLLGRRKRRISEARPACDRASRSRG